MKTFFITIILLFSIQLYSQSIFKLTMDLMGSTFEITVVAKDSMNANLYIEMAVKEISRIEKLISSWDASSQTANINRNAGIKPVIVDTELFNLIQRALKIAELTDGAFDISYASMDTIWKFDGSVQKMPTVDMIKRSVSKVGYQNCLLHKEKSTVFLKKTGMKIGFGAIGKGYAADMAKQILIKEGVVAGIINASGDMNTWGKQPDGTEWQVAITNPMDKNKAFALLPLYNSAVVTSGNYEKFIILEGKKYSHIIDPRTGYPTSGIVSATVFAQKAELADALSTSLFVMGTEVGINRINQLKGVECIIIDIKGIVHTSNNIKINEKIKK